jgi:putative ABC transport system permease protein
MLSRLKTALRALLVRSDMERELDDELRHHIERQTEQNIRLGMNAEEASYAARKAFGGVEQAKERSRDARGARCVEELWQDLRYGARMALKNPGFTLIAIITLGLGIGMTTAIFSVVDALLLRSLPYPDAERLVFVREVGAKGQLMTMSEPNFEDLKARSQSFAAMAIPLGSYQFVVTGGNETARVGVTYTTSKFFEVMGVRPIAGRAFLLAEEKYGGPAAVLISERYRRRMLGAHAELSAVKLNVDGISCNIVGVLPPEFDYPADTEIWITRGVESPNTKRKQHRSPVVGRLRPGVTLAQARAEVSAIGRELRQQYGEATDAVDFALIPLQEHLTSNVRKGLSLLLGAAGLLLLTACANFSNLLLAQLTTRQRELAVRTALGASRPRLARQLVIENLCVSLPAAALGALLAMFGVYLLSVLDKGALPRVNDISIDGRALLFACGLAVLIALALGILPALLPGRQDLQFGLKESERGLSASLTRRRLRGALVVAQISLTLVLLAGAGLLARSFLKLMLIDPGFKADGAVVMTLALPSTVTPREDDELRRFYAQLLERVTRWPGVTAAGGINALPLASRGASGSFLIDNDPSQRGYAEYRGASAGYFAAMNIPLLQGRIFGSEDTINSPHVAVISQSLAQRYWPNEDPIGKRIQFGELANNNRLLHVVGVVGDVRDVMLEREAQPTVYAFSLQQQQWWQVMNLSIVVRTQSNPQSMIPALRTTVRELRADTLVYFRTLEQVFSSALDQRRFSLVLLAVFGAVTLLIAAIGLYGTLAYTVEQRTQEIGVRMALGAERRDVLLLIVGQGLKLALMGVGIGLLAAFALTRWMETLLFGVRPADPLTFAVIAIALLCVALLVCWMPARLATRVDPMVALRAE